MKFLSNKPAFTASIENVSVLRKLAVLSLLSSIVPMSLLTYDYFTQTRLNSAVMMLMTVGVLVGYLSTRSLLSKAIQISSDNRKAIDPFLGPDTIRELDAEKNEIVALNRTFAAVKQRLEENISELEKKNTELQALDRMKDDFVNNVSHEFRLPLTIIQESIRQISEGMFGQVSAEQQQYFEMCLRNTSRLKTLVDNMLDVSKMESGKFGIVKSNLDIKKIIEEIIFEFSQRAREKGIAIKSDCPAGPLEVEADKDKITQVFLNLVGNACKFTDKGCILISARLNNGMVECTVADTGYGIAPADINRLFSKFQQVGRQQQEKGTGLGLVISKHIIELHNGSVRVESEEGAGTKFIFTLPLAKGQKKGQD